MVILVVAALALGIAALFARRAAEVACLSVRGGRVLVVRGAAPGAFVNDVADVMRRSKVSRATIRVVRGEAAARIDASGLSAGDEQRIRNVLGTYSMRALRQAAPVSKRNVGQLLGIAWLAWLLSDRSA